MIKRGIDLYHGNVITSDEALARYDFDFVILKATEGISFTDPTFSDRLKLFTNLRKTVGAYHFARPGDPIAQAHKFLSVAGTSCDLYALDIEVAVTSPTLTGAWVNNFMHVLDSELPTVPLFVYTYPDFLANNTWGTAPLNWKLWLADHTGTHSPHPWSVATMVQYTSTGRVPGVSGNVDMDTWMIPDPTTGGETVTQGKTTADTLHVADYRTPTPAKPYTERDLTVAEMVAQSYEMLTQLVHKMEHGL